MRSLWTILLTLAACSGAPATPTASPSPGRPAPTASQGPSAPSPASAVAEPGWKCLGDPPDIAPGWKLEMAASPLGPGSLEEAMRAAQSKLKAKICAGAEGDRAAADACLYLSSKIEPWKTGRSDRENCASAVVKRQYIDDWEKVASDLRGFDAALASSAKYFVQLAGTKTPRIALAAVYDDGGADPKQNQLPGGRRADWLAARFRAAFPAGFVPAPKSWATGQPAPKDVDLVLVGRMFKRHTVTIPTVDVSWTASTRDGRQLESASGSFPEAAAPTAPAVMPPPIPTTEGLYISMDSDHAGSICAGETTQLWLKTNEELHVRVFELYGKDRAMLIFPPQASSNDVVAAGRTIPLGDPKGFEAVPLPGYEEERYLVLAAPTVAGLGHFGAASGYCRVSDGDATLLHRGELPLGAKVAVTGYRVLTGRGCPPPPSAEHVNAVNAAIARLPICSR